MICFRWAVCGLIAAAALVVVAPAAAVEVTRPSYREAVEPICQANTKTNERILRGVRAEVKHGKLKLASSQFSKAAEALKQTTVELKAVPEPAADQARLTKWLKDVGGEASLFEVAAKKLKAGNKAAAQAVVVRLTHNAEIANNVVISFEFHYCRLEPSKFT